MLLKLHCNVNIICLRRVPELIVLFWTTRGTWVESTNMANRKSRLKERVLLRRKNGQSAIGIALYVYNKCGTSWSKKFLWTLPEREELERLDREFIARKTEKARRAADVAESSASVVAANQVSRTPPLAVLGRGSLSPTAVREILECTSAELDRWAGDGRLSPDGQRHYYGVGPLGGYRWGRAWKPETVSAAKKNVTGWRAQDVQRFGRGWTSEAALFELVRSQFPDAVFQWSPHWLGRQSVDVYVALINVAIEYQGEQHYRPIARFGGEEGFRETKSRDVRKRELLTQQGVALVEWRFDIPIVGAELDRALGLVKPAITSPPP